MSIALQIALEKFTTLLGKVSGITIDDDDGWKIEIFDWSAYSQQQRSEFVEDVLREAWEERGRGYVKDGQWVSKDFMPFAVIGPGESAVEQVDWVLFFNLKDATPARVPVHSADEYNTDVAKQVFAESTDILLQQIR